MHFVRFGFLYYEIYSKVSIDHPYQIIKRTWPRFLFSSNTNLVFVILTIEVKSVETESKLASVLA